MSRQTLPDPLQGKITEARKTAFKCSSKTEEWIEYRGLKKSVLFRGRIDALCNLRGEETGTLMPQGSSNVSRYTA